MAARRPTITVDTSRLAVTSSRVMLGLGYLANVTTVEEIIELLRDGSVSGRIFVGVEIGRAGAPGLKAFEDSDEIADKGKSSRGRSRKGQR